MLRSQLDHSRHLFLLCLDEIFIIAIGVIVPPSLKLLRESGRKGILGRQVSARAEQPRSGSAGESTHL